LSEKCRKGVSFSSVPRGLRLGGGLFLKRETRERCAQGCENRMEPLPRSRIVLTTDFVDCADDTDFSQSEPFAGSFRRGCFSAISEMSALGFSWTASARPRLRSRASPRKRVPIARPFAGRHWSRARPPRPSAQDGWARRSCLASCFWTGASFHFKSATESGARQTRRFRCRYCARRKW
jgi:hypothetical protein